MRSILKSFLFLIFILSVVCDGDEIKLIDQKVKIQNDDTNIAVLVAGEIRSFENIETRKHFIKAVLEPNQFPDLFFHLSHQASFPQWKTNTKLHIKKNSNAKNIQLENDIKNEFNPIIMKFMTSPSNKHASFARFSQIFARWNYLLNDMKKQEIIRGYQYKYVFRTRPDIGYVGKMDIKTFQLNDLKHQDYGIFLIDYFALFTRNAAEIALNPDLECLNYPPCHLRVEMIIPTLMEKYKFGVYSFTIFPFIQNDLKDKKSYYVGGLLRQGHCEMNEDDNKQLYSSECFTLDDTVPAVYGCPWGENTWIWSFRVSPFQFACNDDETGNNNIIGTDLEKGKEGELTRSDRNLRINTYPRYKVSIDDFRWAYGPIHFKRILNQEIYWNSSYFFLIHALETSKSVNMTEDRLQELHANFDEWKIEHKVAK